MEVEEKAVSVFNDTIIRPEKFYLRGFRNIPHTVYFYVFLCSVYIITVLGNGLLLSVIFLVKSLHTAKYMIVFNLALTDLCESTALIPKLLDTFLFDRRYIVYEACLSYMFFVLYFTAMQSWTLLTMSFDRFVAICFPLRYHSIVTKPVIAVALIVEWVFALAVVSSAVKSFDRLSFCRSLEIKSFFCDHGPVFTLACNDRSLNSRIAFAALSLYIIIPFLLIGLTYVCISIILSRLASGKGRFKAMKTCTSHLILVAIFFLPIIGTNSAVYFNLHPNARIINSSLTHTIPALLNPVVYSLKSEEVMNSIRNLFKRNRISRVTTKY